MHPSDPGGALDLLIEGNMRFAGGECEHPNTDTDHVTRMSMENQRPFAAVLTCADSRVPVERVFDRGVGDLFVVRVAGNVCDVAAAASLEFAATALDCPLIVVMGHTQCGAVAAACSPERHSDVLEILLDPIRHVASEQREGGADGDGDLIGRVLKANVRRSMDDLVKESPVIARLNREGSLAIVPAVYDLATGVVCWLET